MRLELDDGERLRTIEGSELRPDANYKHRHSARVETPYGGRLAVTITLLGRDGAVLERGTVELELRPDWAWEIQLHGLLLEIPQAINKVR